MDRKAEKEFILQCLKNGDTAPIIERAKELITEMYPITIVSYKNRYSRMYEYFEKKQVPFTIFVYEDDFTASGYDKYQFQYGTFYKITEADFDKYNMYGKGLPKKRFFIQKYMEEQGIKKYFMMDDDYRPDVCAQSVKKGSDNKLEYTQIEFKDALKTVQYMFEVYSELGIACPSSEYSIKNYKFKNPVIHGHHLSCCFVCNGDILKEHDCYWTKETTFEDLEMAIQASVKKVPWGRFAPVVIRVMSSCNKQSVIPPERSDLAFNLYKLHPHCIVPKMVYDKSLKKYVLAAQKKPSRYGDISYPYDKDLYTYAVNHTLEEFKEHLMNEE